MIEILYIIITLFGLGFIAAIIFGFFKLESIPSLSNELSSRLQETLNSVVKSTGDIQYLATSPVNNPTYMWAVFPTDSSETVPCPQLLWRRIGKNRNTKRFQEVLKKEFLKEYSLKMGGWAISPISSHGRHFLEDIEPELRKRGVEIFWHDYLHPTPTDKEIVLFDVTFNTGGTLKDILDSSKYEGQQPHKLITLIFNDTIPPKNQFRHWNDGFQFESLYKISEVFQYWSNNEELKAALHVVQVAVHGINEWEDSDVKQALQILRTQALDP